MSFAKLIESELFDLSMTAEQKRVVKDLKSMDWEIQEGFDSDNPVFMKPGTNVAFEVTDSGKLQEVKGE